MHYLEANYANEYKQLDHGWLSYAVLLHSSTEFPNVEIGELPARNKGGPYFELLNTAETVTACDVSGSIVPSPRLLYLPCHGNCVSIAKRIIARSAGGSMRHLWLVLESFFTKASEEKFGPICNIYSAQAYGDIWRFQELVWQPGTDPKARFDSMVKMFPYPFINIGLTAFSTLKQTQKIFQT